MTDYVKAFFFGVLVAVSMTALSLLVFYVVFLCEATV